MLQDWLQPAGLVASTNLTFVAEEDNTASNAPSHWYDGPDITLTAKPAEHYPPPPATKAPNKEGLLIGLPVSLGFCLIVVVGLFIGMRKHRKIGLGNIMSRSRGYVSRKSRRERLGRQKGHIRLEEREVYPEQHYRDDEAITPAPRNYVQPRPEIQINGHTRDISLGSLVSEGDEQTARRHGGNAFRDEIEKQRTGRRQQ